MKSTSLIQLQADYVLPDAIRDFVNFGVLEAAYRSLGKTPEQKLELMQHFANTFKTAADDDNPYSKSRDEKMDMADRRGNFSLLVPFAAAYCALAKDLNVPVDLDAMFLNKLNSWIDIIEPERSAAVKDELFHSLNKIFSSANSLQLPNYHQLTNYHPDMLAKHEMRTDAHPT